MKGTGSLSLCCSMRWVDVLVFGSEVFKRVFLSSSWD